MNLEPYIYKSLGSFLNKKAIAFSLLLLSLSAVNLQLHGQQGRNTRQIAVQAFASGNYEKAYAGFTELLVDYPKDPLYKYYAGASLVETGKNPALAVELLRQAMNAASFRKLPVDAQYYLGRAEHMQGNFGEAIDAYNRYTSESGKKAAREKNIPGLIAQCRNGEGKSARTGSEMIAVNQPSLEAERESLPPEVDKQMGETLDKQFREDSLRRAKNLRLKPAPAARTASEREVPSRQARNVKTIRDTVQIKEILSRQSGVLSLFEVLPAPVTDPREQIAINPQLPDGLIYMIQIGVFRNVQTLATFKGISPIYGFRAEGSSSTMYSAGLFRRMSDASKALSSVRAKGFRDSFVVARIDGKTVSKDRAAVLEKEWGNAPLFSVKEDRVSNENDTVPPTLAFRVEVARTRQPLTRETINSYIKFAGDKGLDVKQLEDGTISYLIGNFITFESADEYTGLLKRNGYRDAKVTAWIGRKEIDVNTAKQLFENLE